MTYLTVTPPERPGMSRDETPPIENLPDERWLPVPGFERFYSVSNMGRLFSWMNDRLIASKANHQGYVQVCLRGRHFSVSHLVLNAFAGPRPTSGSWYVRHKDGDRSNCALDNLTWRPRAELRRGIRKPRTHCVRGHELTSKNTLRRAGHTRCLTCHPLAEVMEESAGE